MSPLCVGPGLLGRVWSVTLSSPLSAGAACSCTKHGRCVPARRAKRAAGTAACSCGSPSAHCPGAPSPQTPPQAAGPAQVPIPAGRWCSHPRICRENQAHTHINGMITLEQIWTASVFTMFNHLSKCVQKQPVYGWMAVQKQRFKPPAPGTLLISV